MKQKIIVGCQNEDMQQDCINCNVFHQHKHDLLEFGQKCECMRFILNAKPIFEGVRVTASEKALENMRKVQSIEPNGNVKQYAIRLYEITGSNYTPELTMDEALELVKQGKGEVSCDLHQLEESG